LLLHEHPRILRGALKENTMLEVATMVMPVAAAGWAALYMLCGGGLGGAILIFLGLKAIGK
jgi:hypothetical protein